MDKRILNALAAVTAALVMTACSSAPEQKAAEVKTEAPKKEAPAEAVAAQNPFWEMYKPARTWATDILPLMLTSGEVPGFKNEGGKAALWTAVFVSPSKHEARTFTWAAADSGTTIHKGVDVGGAQPWSGATAQSKPFSSSEFSVNSDTAYATAMKKAAEWVSKNPDKKVVMTLASSSRFPAPVWYMKWGNDKSGYVAFVNATTGVEVTK